MKVSRSFRSVGIWMGALALILTAFPATAQDVQSFQFSDAFYLANGVDPTLTGDHFVFPDAKPGFNRTALGTSPDPAVYNDVRVIENTGGFKHNGNLLYYIAPATVMPFTFTNNAAGDNARAICNEFRAFLFPKANGDPLSPAPPNRRQDNIFETNGGYWSNNPLGCWRLTFVAWDGPNMGSEDCDDFLADQIEEHGVDLDGTGVIRTLSEIEKGVSEGCLRLRQRAEDGSQAFPWVV